MAHTRARDGLLILGMHRSGTSALTRVLSLMGYALPRNVMGASAGNETGHWESVAVADLSDDILDEMGLSWSSWESIPKTKIRTKRRNEIIADYTDAIEAEFPGREDFVLKDPRLCRLTPFVLPAMEAAGVNPKIIIPVRNPLEVAESLKARNDMSRDEACLLWLQYVLEAELGSRDVPRAFMFYEELLENPEDTVRELVAGLDLSPRVDYATAATEISRFLDDKLKHHAFSREDIALEPATRDWVNRAYNALFMAVKGQAPEKAQAELDALRIEISQAMPTLERVTGHLKDEKAALSAELAHKEQALEEAGRLEANLKDTVAEQSDHIQKLDTVLGTIGQAKSELETEKFHLEGVVANLETSLKQQSDHVDVLNNKLMAADLKAREDAARLRMAQEEAAHQSAQALQEKSRADQATVDYSALEARFAATEENRLAQQREIQHLHAVLAAERRTVLKPALRRLRSLGGKSLRAVLPNRWVDRMAFTVPTAEQRLILQMREQEGVVRDTVSVSAPLSEEARRHRKPDIFIFAIIGWHFRTQRPQHIARELSERGHRVFYFEMDPPAAGTEIEELSPTLTRIKLKPEGVPHIQAYTGVPTAAQEKAWLKAFFDFCDSVDATPHKEVIVQHPFWWQLVSLLPPDYRTLYDCMDDIAGFDNSTQELIDLEHRFLSEVDDLVVSGSTLFDKYSEFKPHEIIRNATELDHFLKPDLSALTAKFKAPSLSHSGKPIKVGYVGAIADWFDSDLLRDVARARPDIEFHLCGNVSADHPKTLDKEPNIKLYGEIPYGQVPAFLSQMDVLIIPFRIIPIIRACDPVKFYEYSALGKPTVSTPLPELDRAKGLFFSADTAVDFAAQIDAAVKAGQDKGFVKKLQNFARENTWADRAAQFTDVMERSYPKVSIVILAYGDPELTNAVIHSLKAEGDAYPNMEILIVDNGSPADAVESMRRYAKDFADVRIIENGENLGFAGGNNVGMEAATGDYVLLLNNDTYVSPGSIYAMMRHLEDHPEIGAIGPMTNNIGNEAKLEIDYASMDEMVSKTRALKTGYRHKHFETRVVAYFAVMFRAQDLDQFGLLSTEYGRGMFEDDDHCHKIRSEGYICAVAEDAFIHHHLSATFSKIDGGERQALFDRNKAIFEGKWGPWVPHQYREGRTASDLQFPNEELE